MSEREYIEAFCTGCDDVRPHVIQPGDLSACICTQCNASQALVNA